MQNHDERYPQTGATPVRLSEGATEAAPAIVQPQAPSVAAQAPVQSAPVSTGMMPQHTAAIPAAPNQHAPAVPNGVQGQMPSLPQQAAPQRPASAQPVVPQPQTPHQLAPAQPVVPQPVMPQQMAPAQPLPMQPMPAHSVPPAQPVAPQPVIPQQTGLFQPAVPQQTAPAQPIATHPVTPPYPEAAQQSVSAHAMPAHQPAVQDPAVVPAQPGQMGGQAVQAPASPTHAAQAPFETLATQPAADQSEEDRIAPRRRALKAGTVSYNGGNMTFPCVIRDISETGARIRTDGDRHPPDTFKLLIELDGFVADCEVVWRDGSQVGIRFIGQPQICAPKRSQVVYPSEVRQNIMVRRKPVGSLG